MNKVINININGLVFYIDEEAFEVLNRYLDALKMNFRNTEGGDEILADIEARIAEMLTERLKNRNEVVSMTDVQAVIAAMGQPEDMDDPNAQTKSKTYNWQGWNKDYGFNPGKRMYRDPDNKIIGGVCSGISEYLGVDPVWIRLLFVVVFFGFGTGLLIYIILWIILPAAKTPSEKLEMRGERVNISNIEKTVKENLDTLKDKIDKEFSHIDGQKIGNRVRDFLHGVFDGMSGAFAGVLYIFTRLLSVIAILVAICVMIAIFSVILGALGIITVNVPVVIFDYFDGGHKAWWLLTLVALVVGLPFLGMMFRGVRHLSGYQGRSRFASAFFSTIWILAIILLCVIGFSSATGFRSSYSFSSEDILRKPGHDTLYLTVNAGEKPVQKYHGNGWIEFDRLWHHIDRAKNNNDPGLTSLDITRSPDNNIHLEKEYYSRGSSVKNARALAETIQYSYLQRDSLIIFDEAYRIPADQKWRGQNVNLDLQVPDGTVIIMKKGMEDIIYDIDNNLDMYDGDMPGHTWKMTSNGLTCLDCANYNKDDDNDSTHTRRHHTRHYDRHWNFSF